MDLFHPMGREPNNLVTEMLGWDDCYLNFFLFHSILKTEAEISQVMHAKGKLKQGAVQKLGKVMKKTHGSKES